MKEDNFKVLKTLSEATARMDLKMFAQKVNLDQNRTIDVMQELAKEGFLQKIGHGFAMTEKGKAALKALTPIPEEKGFQFYLDVGKPLGLTALTLEEFYKLVSQVPSESLDFHLSRGDFEKWFTEVYNEKDVSNEIGGIKCAGFQGDELREELRKTLELKFGADKLS